MFTCIAYHDERYSNTLKKPHKHPPEMMGRVRLSSQDPTSNASATPDTRPQTSPSAPIPIQLAVWAASGPTTASGNPIAVSHREWSITFQLSRVSFNEANDDQKPTAMAAPVKEAAMKPASDFRGARGRPRRGNRRGSAGVYEPQRRPNVDAAVSAQERLKLNQDGGNPCKNKRLTLRWTR